MFAACRDDESDDDHSVTVKPEGGNDAGSEFGDDEPTPSKKQKTKVKVERSAWGAEDVGDEAFGFANGHAGVGGGMEEFEGMVYA